MHKRNRASTATIAIKIRQQQDGEEGEKIDKVPEELV